MFSQMRTDTAKPLPLQPRNFIDDEIRNRCDLPPRAMYLQLYINN